MYTESFGDHTTNELFHSQIRPAAFNGIGGAVDVNATGTVVPGSSAITSFGVASFGATVPLFSTNRADVLKVVA